MYVRFHVSRSAAALSYFLTLTVFPLLICLYSALRQYIPDTAEIMSVLQWIVPAESLDTLSDYIGYITSHSSTGMFIAGVAVAITSSSAAFRGINAVFSEMQGRSRFHGIFSFLFSFILSIIFLVLMYFAAVVILSSDWLLNFLGTLIPALNVVLLWKWLRFVLLFAVLLMVLFGIYRMSAPRGGEHHLFLGALVASVALLVISMLFSWFVGMSTRYSLVYGSLASMIILMFWLYVCGNIIIMGNALNMVLRDLREQK
jgi:membrane protein